MASEITNPQRALVSLNVLSKNVWNLRASTGEIQCEAMLTGLDQSNDTTNYKLFIDKLGLWDVYFKLLHLLQSYLGSQQKRASVS